MNLQCVFLTLLLVHCYSLPLQSRSLCTYNPCGELQKKLCFYDSFSCTRDLSHNWKIANLGLQNDSFLWTTRGNLIQIPNGTNARQNPLPDWCNGHTPGTVALIDGINWRDVYIKFMMKSTEWNDIGVVFRYQDENNYFRFTWSHHPYNIWASCRRLVHVAEGNATEFSPYFQRYTNDQWHIVEITVKGPYVTAWIDRNLAFNYSTAVESSGMVGFFCMNNFPCFFDNILVVNTEYEGTCNYTRTAEGCSNRGQCVAKDTCICDPGHVGQFCEDWFTGFSVEDSELSVLCPRDQCSNFGSNHCYDVLEHSRSTDFTVLAFVVAMGAILLSACIVLLLLGMVKKCMNRHAETSTDEQTTDISAWILSTDSSSQPPGSQLPE